MGQALLTGQKLMSRTLSDIEAELLQLPPNDRAALAMQLLASLETSELGDVQRSWIEEAERRYQAYLEGKLSARPANEAIQDARAKLK